MTRNPRIRERLTPALAGRLINEIRDLAVLVKPVPVVAACADLRDDHLLAMAVAGEAEFLVTGDAHDLMTPGRYRRTRIVTVRTLPGALGRLP